MIACVVQIPKCGQFMTIQKILCALPLSSDIPVQLLIIIIVDQLGRTS